LRLRYGVQVNSLGLTEAQPENNVPRIVLEALAVTLGRSARARAIQLPAWNEALGLPRPWDQQWSLRIQQILAYETDLLEYPDIFAGSVVMDGLVEEIAAAARGELAQIEALGGAVAAIPYMKAALVESNRARVERIERGEQVVVGVNRFTETAPSPLTADGALSTLIVDPAHEAAQIAALERWRAEREDDAVQGALAQLAAAAAAPDGAIMEASLACARAGVSTGEWAGVLRERYGSYRAPTGIGEGRGKSSGAEIEALRASVAEVSKGLGRRLKLLVGKPGLDGHSNGAEQIAVYARDAGIEVVYGGIRMTPEEIASSAQQEGVHVVGLSMLSGSHMRLASEVLAALHAEGCDVPVIVGGIIPEHDAAELRQAGVAAVYTPKDFELHTIIADIVRLASAAPPAATAP
jgi:(2R)-ethylmalonyl-CoA mutase